MNENAKGSFLGLGYFHATQPDAQMERSDSAVDAANKLMQQYLQQCLEYHHEQEDLRRNEQAVPIVDTELQFVPAAAVVATGAPNVVETSLETPKISPVSIDTTAQSQSQQSTIDDPSLMSQQVQEGRLRVQEILKRFHQQQEEFLQPQSSLPPVNDMDGISTDMDGTPTTTTGTTFNPDDSPSLYEQQRITAFQREAVRKHAALLKNLEYVALKQDQRLHQLTAQAEQSRLDQARMQEHHRAVLEERKRARISHTSSVPPPPQQKAGGIGSKQRKVGDHSRRIKGQPRTDKNAGANTDDRQSSVAIYVSGLETDGSSFVGGGGRDEQEQESVRSLFASYGKIVKVRVYRNKMTGDLKGDALVVFQVSCQVEGDALVQMVCSQVSRLAFTRCC
jgi:hypothetical protein